MEYNFDEMIRRIKIKKKEAGLTNKQLSELADVPYGTLNKILGSETKEPSINAIIKIAIALGVSTEYIIYGEKEKSPPPADKWEALKIMLETLSDDDLSEVWSFVKFQHWRKQQENQG